MNLFNTFLNIIFPRKCINCKTNSNNRLCEVCFKQVIPKPEKTQKIIISAFSYKNPIIKQAIWDFKFNKSFLPLVLFIEQSYEVLLDELSNFDFDPYAEYILIPIPLHKNRQKQRGFNQSEIIARKLCACNPKIFKLSINNLIRSRETTPQAKIQNKDERKENIKKCFSLQNPKSLKNKNIILIDDVTTTGSTILEAKKILKQHNVKNVIAFTIAH